jgi:hypothetical protein
VNTVDACPHGVDPRLCALCMEDALTILTAKPDALSVTAGSYDPIAYG